MSGWHDDRDAEGASIEVPKAPCVLGYREGCPLLRRLGGLGERRELPQRGPGWSPGRYRIFCIFETTERFWQRHSASKIANSNLKKWW